jgi:hypothetical protein
MAINNDSNLLGPLVDLAPAFALATMSSAPTTTYQIFYWCRCAMGTQDFSIAGTNRADLGRVILRTLLWVVLCFATEGSGHVAFRC